MAATNLLVDITQTGAQSAPSTWGDLASLTGSPTVQGTGSVCLMIASVSIDDATGDECMQMRFVVDGTPVGPEMGAFSDATDEANSVTMAFAVDGLSAAAHTFKVQFQLLQNSPSTDAGFETSFQVIEFVDNAALVVDVSSAALDAPVSTYTDIIGLTGNFTPTADSLHLFIANLSPETGNSVFADVQCEIGTTLEGPASTTGISAANEEHGTCIMWARTGLAASSTDVAMRWRGIGGSAETPDVGTTNTRTFQIIEVTADFSLETDVEVTSAATAPATFAAMTDMTDATVAVDSADSVILALAHYVQAGGADETALARMEVDSSLVGPTIQDFTDASSDRVGRQLAWAADGLTGTIAVELHWQIHKSTPTVDTARERTFQVIDFKAGAAGDDVTLTASPGTLNITGGVAGFVVTAVAAAAALALTGGAATLATALAADPGAIALTGGESAAVITLAADPGSLSLTGGDATLSVSTKLTADPGTLALTGGAATTDMSMSASPGALTLTGGTATLSIAQLLAADSGALVLTGGAADFTETLSAAPGTLTLTGGAATLSQSTVLPADPGSLALTGSVANFIASLAASPGALTLTGGDVTLTTSEAVVAAPPDICVAAESETVLVAAENETITVLAENETISVAFDSFSRPVDATLLYQGGGDLLLQDGSRIIVDGDVEFYDILVPKDPGCC